MTLWPPSFPEAIPTGFCKTPKDEFKVNRVFPDKAVETDKSFASLIGHTWSLGMFNPNMKMLDLTFTYVRGLRLKPCTYAQLYEYLSGSGKS